MATWTITPKKGTTAQWRDSARILEVNEWGVEETESGAYILRIGDGQHEFLDLPVVVDVAHIQELTQTVENFTTNMQQATANANIAAQAAETATSAAQAAATACQNIEAGINSMSDSVTGKVYTIGIEAGVVFLQEVES